MSYRENPEIVKRLLIEKGILEGKLSAVGNKYVETEAFTNTEKEREEDQKKIQKLKDAILKKDNEIYNILHGLIYEDAFEWRFEFPEVLDDEGKFIGFDAVIGNPPYISAPAMVEKNSVMRQTIVDSGRFTTLHQKWDIFIPFLELGLQILISDGVLSMIVPYPFTNQMYGKKMRDLIVNQYNLVEIVDLQGIKVFGKAAVSNCIPIVIKNNSAENRCFVSKINEQRQITRAFCRPYSDLVQNKDTSVWHLSSEKRDASRYSKMPILGDFCYISYGLRPNSDEKTAKGEFTKDDLISETYDDIHCKKYIEAKDIEKYRIKKIRYLEYNTERCPNKLVRPTFRELYEKPKLMANILGTLTVIIDETQSLLHNHSLTCAVLWKDLKGVENKSISASVKRYSRLSRAEMEALSEQIDLRFLLGVLNSRYASVLLSNLRGGDYHIYPEYLRNLPIPSVSAAEQQPIIELVDKILAAKDNNPQADTITLEREIDVLVYLLYDLTEEEVRVVEGN